MNIAAYIKIIAKKLQSILPFAISKNEQYDRSTKKIIFKICRPDSACIDIGSNEGKILDWMISAAPLATHYAFEPIPELYESLTLKYQQQARIFPIALSQEKGKKIFNYVVGNPALSGLKKRPDTSSLQHLKFEVETDLLDNLIPLNQKIQLIKMDVEGGEWHVLRGASGLIQKNKPFILFEFGKIGAEMYDFSAIEIFDLFTQYFDYKIFTLKDWLDSNTALSFERFEYFFENGKEYFFVAAPNI